MNGGRIVMVKVIFSLSCACLLVFLGHIDCAAFRCGDGFVSEGASKTKVLLECGKPTSMEKAGVKKEPGEQTTKGKDGERKAKHQKDKQDSKDSRPAVRGEYDKVSKKRIEKWYYNCGDNDFIYVLTFEGGVLKKEETGGYGKGKSACQGKNR
jgi:hypothetical protein